MGVLLSGFIFMTVVAYFRVVLEVFIFSHILFTFCTGVYGCYDSEKIKKISFNLFMKDSKERLCSFL